MPRLAQKAPNITIFVVSTLFTLQKFLHWSGRGRLSLASPFIVTLTEQFCTHKGRGRRRELKAINISKDAFGHVESEWGDEWGDGGSCSDNVFEWCHRITQWGAPRKKIPWDWRFEWGLPVAVAVLLTDRGHVCVPDQSSRLIWYVVWQSKLTLAVFGQLAYLCT